MYEEIDAYLTKQNEIAKTLDGVMVGSIIAWYDETQEKPVLYSRVISFDELGVMVDVYPDTLPAMSIPWCLINQTRFGFTVMVGFKFPIFSYMGLPYKSINKTAKKKYKVLNIWPTIHHPGLTRNE